MALDLVPLKVNVGRCWPHCFASRTLPPWAVQGQGMALNGMQSWFKVRGSLPQGCTQPPRIVGFRVSGLGFGGLMFKV